MDVLQFIASLIGSLAWPAAVIILVLILRSPLQSVLRGLTRFRYGEIEMDFGQEVQILETQARTAGLQVQSKLDRPKLGPPKSTNIIADAGRLAVEFPGPAVGLAWTAVEHEIMQAINRLNISADYPPYNSSLKNISILHDNNYLDSDSVKVLDRMRRLRNAAVHSLQEPVHISASDAREFVALAGAVVDKLKGIGKH